MTAATSDPSPKTLTHMRRLVALTAGAALGITGAFTWANAQDDTPTATCGPTETDLLRAAEAARALEAERPDLFALTQPRADYDDLRLAAEWAARMAVLDPDAASCAGSTRTGTP